MSNENSIYNADELVAPDWLNEEFFRDILSKKFGGSPVVVRNLKITPGTTKSDHYGSVMFRARVTYTLPPDGGEKVQSLIIKTGPAQDSEKKKQLEGFDVFGTEIKMYSETLPKIESILRRNADHTKLYADAFHYSLAPNECIIFEDLVELGYGTIAQRNANIEEVKAALLKLAKLHAISYKLAQEGDASMSTYNDGIFSNDKILNFKFVVEGFSMLKETIEKDEDLRSYVPHLERVEKGIFERILSSFNAYRNGKRDGIFVLNHGDFHMKNMMTKYKGKTLEDLMLVDFQISVYASPAVDLIYAFVMLFSPEMRRRNRDELFQYYFSNFQETLRLNGFKGRIPTMTDFQKEIAHHADWELFLAVSFLLVNHLFCDPEGDLKKFVEEETYRRELWQRKEVIQEMRILLPFYLHRGYFEK